MKLCVYWARLNEFNCLTPQNSNVESFQCKLSPLSSSNLEKLRHILDHRCIVGGGEQIFLLALGVRCNSNIIYIFAITWTTAHSNGTHVASGLFKWCWLYLRLEQLSFCACAEVPDVHLGWEDAAALEETGVFQAGAAQRYTSKCGDCSRAEGRGKRQEELNKRSCIVPLSRAPPEPWGIPVTVCFISYCCEYVRSSGQGAAKNQCSPHHGCTGT